MRLALWLTGLLAALLYVYVARFGFFTLAPELGCKWGPETRLWGYSADAFHSCLANIPDPVRNAYRDVLTGVDRFLALALGVYLALLAIRCRAWPGIATAGLYALGDWKENGALVELLDGAGSVAVASTWTTLKFAMLGCTVLICWLYARKEGKAQ